MAFFQESHHHFSARIQRRASPAEEDDWLAWRSAYRMLADWQKAYEALKSGHARI